MDRSPRSPDTLSPPAASRFRATVHGLAFAGRDRRLRDVEPGDVLLLIPDPADATVEQVWVHLEGGAPLGHLPDEIGRWLAPWMRTGNAASVRAVRVGDETVPSWKRLVVEVDCRREGGENRIG